MIFRAWVRSPGGFRHAGQRQARRVPVGRRLVGMRQDRRATVAIITAMLASALIGFGALAVDVGIWKTNQAAMQGAADQAAYAASYNISYGVPMAQAEGKAVAAANGFKESPDGVSVVTIKIPAQSGTYYHVPNSIEAIVAQPQTSFLSGVFSSGSVNASGRAVVVPVTGPTCIMTLGSGDYGINVTGAATINATGCDVFDNSVSSPGNCDVQVVGVTAVTGYDIFLGQPACPQLTVTVGDTIKAPAAPSPDPYASYTAPTAASPCKSIFPLLVVTLSTPGTYCGFSVTGPLTLNLTTPGIYIFTGDINVTGLFTVNGTNVTVVMSVLPPATSTPPLQSQSTTINATGGVSLNISAPTTGPTAGIALWVEGSRQVNLTGLIALNIVGALYAPNAALSYIGLAGSGTASACTQVIVSSLEITGTLALQHNKCAGTGVQDAIAAYKLEE